MFRKSGGLICALLLIGLSAGSAAEKKYGPGATDTEIKLGQTVPYSGPASAFLSYGRLMTGYFEMVNASGGINGRKITLISLDNAFSPPKALEQTRKLVEDSGVLADVGTVGTTPNVAIQKYLNQAKVPHIFISAGGRRFADPQNFPWSVPMYPGFEMEGKTFGQYILKNKPDAKIGVLYQNDDYGKDFLTGLKAAIGEGKTKIVAEVAYELTDPTIDSQIVRLKAAQSEGDELDATAVPRQPDQLGQNGVGTGRIRKRARDHYNAVHQAGRRSEVGRRSRSEGVRRVHEEMGAKRQSRRFRCALRIHHRAGHRPGIEAVRRRSHARESAEAGDQYEGKTFQNDVAGNSAQYLAR